MNAQLGLIVDRNASLDSLRYRQACDASPRRVFEVLTDRQLLEAWWLHPVRGLPQVGGQLSLGRDDPQAGIVVEVTCAADGAVDWLVTEDRSHGGEWLDTVVSFRIRPCGSQGSMIDFGHEGLTPALDCYEPCMRVWDKVLARIAAQAEGPLRRGVGG